MYPLPPPANGNKDYCRTRKRFRAKKSTYIHRRLPLPYDAKSKLYAPNRINAGNRDSRVIGRQEIYALDIGRDRKTFNRRPNFPIGGIRKETSYLWFLHLYKSLFPERRLSLKTSTARLTEPYNRNHSHASS